MNNLLLETVRGYLRTEADPGDLARSPVPGLTVIRSNSVGELAYAVSRPLACLVVQGAKQVTTGAQTFAFSAGQSLIVTADVPIVSQVTRASPGEPYLSLVLDLDRTVVAELCVEMRATCDAAAVSPVQVGETDAEVADGACRLMRLLDHPGAVPILHAPVMRELHYWLLTGRHGGAIRRLGWPESYAGRVARAVAVLRSEFRRPLRMRRLAEAAGMSASSFHHHFREATSLSPLQFQKQLRLIEARRLMMSESASASAAAFAVGYESAPQFTREYRRMFGAPPAREVDEAKSWIRAAA